MLTYTPAVDQPAYLSIADFIEAQVQAGLLAPNQRLAPTEELAVTFGVSVPTLQRGLARLVERGLLRRTPRLGTFVNPRSNTHTIALVFGTNPFARESGYYRLLYKQIQEQAAAMNLHLSSYLDLGNGDVATRLRELEVDIRERRHGFLIALCRTDDLNRWLDNQTLVPWVIEHTIDHHALTAQGLAYLQQRGYRKIGILLGGSTQHVNDECLAAYRERFGDLPPWSHRICPGTGDGGYACLKTWFANPADRPDALFINHDVVLRGALLAILELGLNLPGDLGLLTHLNKGDFYHSPVPMSGLVVDPAAVTAQLLMAGAFGSQTQRTGRLTVEHGHSFSLVVGRSCGEPESLSINHALVGGTA